jgi:hypothetical protein
VLACPVATDGVFVPSVEVVLPLQAARVMARKRPGARTERLMPGA